MIATLETEARGGQARFVHHLIQHGFVVTAERPCGGGTIHVFYNADPYVFEDVCEMLYKDGFEIADPNFPLDISMGERREIPFWKPTKDETLR